eukprot:CAMPEP_0185271600 /NCGR_PEP_ID=MMETSP1359-20130426/45147_1 /TAXON_ID=552665 /ORGANISM="Bigelowiella longifila, Strain CCMP242" /LENGTH=88 /DNA_ID=CAMNT_0027863587 /DNA_START=306 /DNA_END=571 /DNA_ORIENTATION=-
MALLSPLLQTRGLCPWGGGFMVALMRMMIGVVAASSLLLRPSAPRASLSSVGGGGGDICDGAAGCRLISGRYGDDDPVDSRMQPFEVA